MWPIESSKCDSDLVVHDSSQTRATGKNHVSSGWVRRGPTVLSRNPHFLLPRHSSRLQALHGSVVRPDIDIDK